MRIRKVFWFAFGLIAFSLLLIWYSGNYSSFPQSRNIFLRLTVLGSLFIIINWFWTFTSIKKLSLIRNQRLLRLQVGNVFEEEFEVINSLRFSRLWIEIEDLSNLSGISGSKVLSGLGGKKNRYYISRTILTKRGSFKLGPTLLRSGDPFGMFTTEKLVASEAQLLVLPYIETITKFTEPPGFIQGGRAIRRKSLEATSFASGVREYQSGDPLNRIHWKSSAKRDKFMVKEFDQDPQADIWIIIDSHEESNSHQIIEEEIQFADTFWALKQKTSFKLPKSTFEYAISISASLASYYIEAEKAVGVACADSVMTVIPTEKGGRQLGKILETMAFFEGKGKMPINEVIESLGYQIIRGSTVVIVSSTDSMNIQLCIEILLRRKLKPVIIQINKESFETSSPDPVFWENNNIPGIIINYGDSISSSLQSITQYDPSVIRI